MKTKEKEKGGAAMMLLTILCVLAFVSAIFAWVIPRDITVVDYLIENKIKILTTKTCGWCQKQMKEFTPEELVRMYDEILVVECNQNGTWVCGNTGTPAWWKAGEEFGQGKVVHEGYIPYDKIIETIEANK